MHFADVLLYHHSPAKAGCLATCTQKNNPYRISKHFLSLHISGTGTKNRTVRFGSTKTIFIPIFWRRKARRCFLAVVFIHYSLKQPDDDELSPMYLTRFSTPHAFNSRLQLAPATRARNSRLQLTRPQLALVTHAGALTSVDLACLPHSFHHQAGFKIFLRTSIDRSHNQRFSFQNV